MRTRSNKEMEGPSDPHYRCVKTSFISVVKDGLVVAKLTDAALRANSTMIHTLQLLKLYLLYCCEEGVELPTLNRQFVTLVMKMLYKPPSQGRPPHAETKRIKETLADFYERYYKA